MPNLQEDVIKNVTTLDIQLLNANRENTTTIKLDNPVSNISREMVSAAMQPAFANEFLLTSKGDVAKYLGDIIVNQSIKRILDGQDYYVTPSELTLSYDDSSDLSAGGTISVSGATIQGYNIIRPANLYYRYVGTIKDNGLTFSIAVTNAQDASQRPAAGTFNVELVIMGQITTIPVTVPEP